MRSQTLAGTCVLLLGIGVPAYASDPPDPTKPRDGRGFMFGLALGPSDTHFGGAEDLVLVIGGPTGTIPLLGGESLEARAGELVPRTPVPVDSEGVVPMRRSQRGAAASLQFGWSFSRRLAVLLDFEANGGWDNSFNHVMGGPQVRYSPTSRLWVQAGPALGELSYGFSSSVVQIPGRGKGFLVAAGLILLRRPMWLLDLQVRALPLWYDQFHANNTSVQLGIIRRRS